VDELVHRHELHRGHTEGREVLDDRRMGETGVCATELLGHVRVALRHPFHVRLVDDRFVQRRVGPAVASPVEMGMLDDRAENEGDRKSTRLNSSHRTSSYAVFCLNKKRIWKQL